MLPIRPAASIALAFLFLLVLSGCGGGSGGDGAFVPEPLRLSLSASPTAIPVNVGGDGPDVGGPFTATLTVAGVDGTGQVRQPAGQPDLFECVLVGQSVDFADLYPVNLDEPAKFLTLQPVGGQATFFLHSLDRVGIATVNCVASDPADGQRREASVLVSIGGAASGLPSQVLVTTQAPRFLVVQDENGPTQIQVQAQVVDEAGIRVPDPAANDRNLFVRLSPADGDPDSPVLQGMELRSADDDDPRHIAVRTINGVATFTVVSGPNTGTFLLEVIADRLDNTVLNGVSNEVRNQLAIPVVPAGFSDVPVSIVTTTLASARVGTPYSQVIEAEGGNPPYRWTRAGGSLPPGLSFSADGVVSGNPTAAGSFAFRIEVQDEFGSLDSRGFTLDVDSAPPLLISTTTVSGGTVGESYAFTFQGTGGVPPYTWLGTALPAGLSLGSSTGTLSGTPLSDGTFSFAVTLRDSLGVSVTRSFSITIAPGAPPPPAALAISTASPLPEGTQNQPYATVLAGTGGVQPYQWTSTVLPAGLTLTPATGALSGTPTATGENFPIVVTLTDAGNQSVSKEFTITISEP